MASLVYREFQTANTMMTHSVTVCHKETLSGKKKNEKKKQTNKKGKQITYRGQTMKTRRVSQRLYASHVTMICGDIHSSKVEVSPFGCFLTTLMES
jgi:hypothetical protein